MRSTSPSPISKARLKQGQQIVAVNANLVWSARKLYSFCKGRLKWWLKLTSAKAKTTATAKAATIAAITDITVVKKHVVCPISEEQIVESNTKKQKAQESFFCDGHCQEWVHRQCAGLSMARFTILSKSSAPFFVSQVIYSERLCGWSRRWNFSKLPELYSVVMVMLEVRALRA